jgi:hypothetical protein|nr:MAG TPA_asm: hypothetical protein [Caudoviricetes sp.]DAM58098.1 MAG TPA: hypothetical protein [Caudoviricetes sp.]
MDVANFFFSLIAAFTGTVLMFVEIWRIYMKGPRIKRVSASRTHDGKTGICLLFERGDFPVRLKSITIEGIKLAKPINYRGSDHEISEYQVHLWASPSPSEFKESFPLDALLDRDHETQFLMLITDSPLLTDARICIKTSRIWFCIRSNLLASRN